jgi:hypothetical protein
VQPYPLAGSAGISLYHGPRNRNPGHKPEHKVEHNNCRMRGIEPDLEAPDPTVTALERVRAARTTDLLNRCTVKSCTGGSNPPPSPPDSFVSITWICWRISGILFGQRFSVLSMSVVVALQLQVLLTSACPLNERQLFSSLSPVRDIVAEARRFVHHPRTIGPNAFHEMKT